MRIGILSSWDMTDPLSWSGVVLPAVTVLSNRAEVVLLQVPPVTDSFVDRMLAKLYGLSNAVYLPSDAFATAFRKASQVRKLREGNHIDVVISLAASKESLGIPSHIPVVQVTDSSFAAMIDGYFSGKKISAPTQFQGHVLDKLVAKKSAHYCVASKWSAEQLIQDTGVLASNITVTPFGPGVQPVTRPSAIQRKPGINLLFIGSHWKRKGGDRALESFTLARAYRSDITLTVIGAPEETPIEGVTYLPRQSKENLSALYMSHDALLEPTEASAGGVVVTDALNHGLPVISTRVGGIPTLVREGKTGWLVSAENAVEEIANLLKSLTHEDLQQTSQAAREDAWERLTWESWGKAVVEICEQVVKNSRKL